MSRLFVLFCLLGSLGLSAQTLTWEVGLLPVPLTPTAVSTQTTHVTQLTLVNVTGSAVVVTVTDRSTNCSGGPCTLFAASVTANTTYTVSLGGTRAVGGVNWNAASANAVHGWIKGNI